MLALMSSNTDDYSHRFATALVPHTIGFMVTK